MKIFLSLIVTLIAMCFCVSSFAAEPTMDETVNFINDKIKRYTDETSIWNRDIPLSLGYMQVYKHYCEGCAPDGIEIEPGDVKIHLSWRDQDGYPYREKYIYIKDFGNMIISQGYADSVFIKDPQDLSTIYVHQSQNRANKCCNDKYFESFISKENKISLYFTNKDITSRIIKALNHLKKLHQERWPNERPKEPF